MKVAGKSYRTIWMEGTTVFMIDQNALPFEFRIYEAKTCQDTCQAIINMITRGAGAIGAAAGFAMAQAFLAEEAKGGGREVRNKEFITLDFGIRNDLMAPGTRNLEHSAWAVEKDWAFLANARKEIESLKNELCY